MDSFWLGSFSLLEIRSTVAWILDLLDFQNLPESSWKLQVYFQRIQHFLNPLNPLADVGYIPIFIRKTREGVGSPISGEPPLLKRSP